LEIVHDVGNNWKILIDGLDESIDCLTLVP